MNPLSKIPLFAAVAVAAMAGVDARHSEYRIEGHTPRRRLPAHKFDETVGRVKHHPDKIAAAEAKRLRRMERNKRGAK